jgi:hypothetical protein
MAVCRGGKNFGKLFKGFGQGFAIGNGGADFLEEH